MQQRVIHRKPDDRLLGITFQEPAFGTAGSENLYLHMRISFEKLVCAARYAL